LQFNWRSGAGIGSANPDLGPRGRLVLPTCTTAPAGRHFGVKNLVTTVLIALGLLCATSAYAEPPWGTDYKKAQDEAKANHKFVLLDFTGSDWCGYCIQLDRAILSQPQFKDYATKNLILVEIDFPRRKPQTVETRKQNQELAERYQIEGFPTLVILNGEGKAVWRYEGLYTGGVAAFLAELDKVRKG
jgi:protein disulfide-isomerase